jgi:hypothetical protein
MQGHFDPQFRAVYTSLSTHEVAATEIKIAAGAGAGIRTPDLLFTKHSLLILAVDQAILNLVAGI